MDKHGTGPSTPCLLANAGASWRTMQGIWKVHDNIIRPCANLTWSALQSSTPCEVGRHTRVAPGVTLSTDATNAASRRSQSARSTSATLARCASACSLCGSLSHPKHSRSAVLSLWSKSYNCRRRSLGNLENFGMADPWLMARGVRYMVVPLSCMLQREELSRRRQAWRAFWRSEAGSQDSTPAASSSFRLSRGIGLRSAGWLGLLVLGDQLQVALL